MVGGKKSYFLWKVCVILLVMPAKSISKSFGYTHDQYGRILTEIRTIDSTAVLGFSYHYNGKGLIDRVTYPEGVSSINYYASIWMQKFLKTPSTIF